MLKTFNFRNGKARTPRKKSVEDERSLRPFGAGQRNIDSKVRVNPEAAARLRASFGLKLKDMGKKCSVSPSYFSKMEKGTQEFVDTKYLSAIARACNVSIHSLMLED